MVQQHPQFEICAIRQAVRNAGGRIEGFAAFEGGRTLARCLLEERPLHPASTTLHFCFDHAGWSDRIAGELLQAVRKHLPGRTLRVCVEDVERPQSDFLLANGFSQFRTTWLGEVSIAACPDHLFKAQYDILAGRISTLATEKRHGCFERWINAHARHYQATHRANPPASQGSDQWTKLFCGPDYVAESSFLIRGNDDLLAFSSLRRLHEGTWDFGWFGALEDAGDLTAGQLNKALKYAEIDWCRRNGIAKLGLEADSTDLHAMHIMKHLPFSANKVFLTFQTGAAL